MSTNLPFSDFAKSANAIVLHVGTNNISDADSTSDITDQFRTTINSIRTQNSNVVIVISSILPRRNDKVVNIIINKTNSALQKLCSEINCIFLNNDDIFLRSGEIDASLYYDNIHLNKKGGNVFGIHLREALNKALNILESKKSTPSTYQADERTNKNNKTFHHGRFPGRRNAQFDRPSQGYMFNPNMMYMPFPPWMMRHQHWA